MTAFDWQLLAVGVIVLAAVVSFLRTLFFSRRRKGGRCCGCGSEGACSGSCDGCTACRQNNKRGKKPSA